MNHAFFFLWYDLNGYFLFLSPANQSAMTYRTVQLLKNEHLGAGSYGAICRAYCDDLPCAAKLLHPILFQFSDPGASSVRSKFEQECHFLSAMKHPHIVQYLGTTHDPDSGLPVLLMELMDESLTHFLEHCQQPLPYHTEVNLCNDIALALAYLHSNDIIHRDLSSNNVLLIAGRKAKITDFGMSKLLNIDAAELARHTTCPGATVYMPPEALRDCPVYSEKLDCFSFGVLEIQIMTRKFPDPGPAMRDITDPRYPNGKVHASIPDTERRKSHINLIDTAHPLLPIACTCLSYSEEERPSAQHLCKQFAALKKEFRYSHSLQQEKATSEQCDAGESGSQMQRKDQQLLMQLKGREQEICRQLQEKDAAFDAKERELQQLRLELQKMDQELQEKQLVIVARERQLRGNEHVIAEFQESLLQKEETIKELRQHLQVPSASRRLSPARNGTAEKLTLSWKKVGKAPHGMYRGSAISNGTVAYFRPAGTCLVYAYDSKSEQWDALPECPQQRFSLAIVEGILTAVGGELRDGPTNSLLSLTGEGKDRRWIELFPPMPTKRYATAVASAGKSLIAAGGKTANDSERMTVVEVLDTEVIQWFTASSLPHPFSLARATVCGDQLYLLGGNDQNGKTRMVLSCSLPELLASSQTSTDVWRRLANVPFYLSTCTTLASQVIAVGGMDATRKETTNIHAYNQTTDSWQPIGDMLTARSKALVAVVPRNKLIVVGGYGGRDVVEIAM